MNFFYVLNRISINETSVRVIKDQIGYSAPKNSPSNASASYLSHVPNVSLTETANEKREYGELQKPPPRDSLIKTLETIQDSYATCSKNKKKTKKGAQSLQTKDMSIRCRPNSSFTKAKLVDFPLVNSRQLSSVDSRQN